MRPGTLALVAAFVASSALAHGDKLDDLDETMVVLDAPTDVREAVDSLDRPDDDDVRNVDWTDDAASDAEEEPEPVKDDPADVFADDGFDDFDRDIVREEDLLEYDDDFEQSEELDDDFVEPMT